VPAQAKSLLAALLAHLGRVRPQPMQEGPEGRPSGLALTAALQNPTLCMRGRRPSRESAFQEVRKPVAALRTSSSY
jgi:hypothetical protein